MGVVLTCPWDDAEDVKTCPSAIGLVAVTTGITRFPILIVVWLAFRILDVGMDPILMMLEPTFMGRLAFVDVTTPLEDIDAVCCGGFAGVGVALEMECAATAEAGETLNT